MRISVYVPCHNNERTISEVVAAIRAQTRPADQLLFIDDQCTDRSPAIASEHSFTVVSLGEKHGLGAGRNRALELASGDILAGFDADVVPAPDYLATLEQLFIASPQYAAIGGRVDERFADAAPDLWRSVHLPLHHGNTPLVNPRLLFGAATAVRVSALRQVEGWNERFTSNFEDADMTVRLRRAGLQLFYAPACRASHLRRDTVESILRGFWNYNYYGYEKDLENFDNWPTKRAMIFWDLYQKFRIRDVSMPRLAGITLLLPWSCVMRDLRIMQRNSLPVGGLQYVADIARDVLKYLGFDPRTIGQVVQWLNALANELQESGKELSPLHPQIVSMMQECALRCIPDCSYDSACRPAMDAISATPVS